MPRQLTEKEKDLRRELDDKILLAGVRAYGSCSNLNFHEDEDENFNVQENVNGTEFSDEDDEEEDDDDDSELSYDDSSDEERNLLHGHGRKRKRRLECKVLDPVLKPILKLYDLVKDAVILITNVDDVWESPAYNRRNVTLDRSGSMRSIQSVSSGSTMHHGRNLIQNSEHTVPSLMQEPTVSLRHKIGVMFWFLLLVSCYALERCSFKILSDRMGPFRMVVGGEIVLAIHFLVIAVWKTLRWLCKRPMKITLGTGMLPLPDIGLMAVLDTIQLLLVVTSGSHVAPILTAILVHVTIPLTTSIQQLLKCGLYRGTNKTESQKEGGQQSLEHEKKQDSQMLFGATLIMLSTILALAPAILTLIYPSSFSSDDLMADRTAWNTLLFFISYVPGSLSQAYKEHTLEMYAQPVDPDMLNMVLSLFSAIFAFVISPFIYTLQGLADVESSIEDESSLNVESWIDQYPSRQFSQNFSDGIQCFMGTLDDTLQVRGYPEEAHCDYAYVIVLLHVFSIIVIGHAVGKICNAGAFKIMHRGISAGIILSVVSLFFYQVFVDDVDYGFIPNTYHIICSVILVIGSEIYHRVTLEMPSFETNFPAVQSLYDDEF
uniref:Uncharacterized protein n=1 Tax=Chaetoceros debilis TaxID=122233 RepID=A0A7S3QAP5_9STRA|mmetsp:Transcript_1305/g.1753  ORF Transcript_1305/g.1753 Transcript_1305/m.1753 type:complete len:603 (+) Transcript_1305:132-1940(+)